MSVLVIQGLESAFVATQGYDQNALNFVPISLDAWLTVEVDFVESPAPYQPNTKAVLQGFLTPYLDTQGLAFGRFAVPPDPLSPWDTIEVQASLFLRPFQPDATKLVIGGYIDGTELLGGYSIGTAIPIIPHIPLVQGLIDQDVILQGYATEAAVPPVPPTPTAYFALDPWDSEDFPIPGQ